MDGPERFRHLLDVVIRSLGSRLGQPTVGGGNRMFGQALSLNIPRTRRASRGNVEEYR